MSIEPLNTLPIQQFLQQVKQAETSRAKDLRMDIATAKNLAFTLGIVMSRMNGDMEKFISQQLEKLNDDQVIQIDMDAGSWK